MLDPLSFAAGSAVVVAGKLIYDAAVSFSRKGSPSLPPPPPPPMPKTKARVRVFVDDIQSVISCSISQPYVPSEGAIPAPPKEKKAKTGECVPKSGFVVSDGDLHRIRLKPTQTKASDHSRRPPVNQLPICADCISQKDKLKHVA